MQFSGYEMKFKGEVVKSAFKAYRAIKEKDERGNSHGRRGRELRDRKREG